MKKSEFNKKFRDYARTLSPTPDERELIKDVYKSLTNLLGKGKCLQIGSYPRFTSITPIHDLDMLYILGEWEDDHQDPSTTMQVLFEALEENYINPTPFKIKVSLQTHSVTVAFLYNEVEALSVDIVPAYIHGKNVYKEDMYKVPEIIKKKDHTKRKELYKKIQSENRGMSWINSDPRGYIKTASIVDIESNSEFRKTTKIIKNWKYNLQSADEELKLKSFHLEQIITEYFQDNFKLEIFDAIFKFFYNLPGVIERPNVIRDRANNEKFIDDYLSDFTDEQKKKIKQARDGFLVKLEKFDEENSIEQLMEIEFYKRFRPTESFLFDQFIPVLTENKYAFEIKGDVLPRDGGFRGFILDKIGLINVDRQIDFTTVKRLPEVDLFKWKVKNDNNSDQPRGEITNHHTLQTPEHTKYSGVHYVECYAIVNNICVAIARQDVKLK